MNLHPILDYFKKYHGIDLLTLQKSDGLYKVDPDSFKLMDPPTADEIPGCTENNTRYLVTLQFKSWKLNSSKNESCDDIIYVSHDDYHTHIKDHLG